MTYLQLEPGVRLFAQDLGDGPAIVFLPGFGLTHAVWDRQVRELAPTHRVICLDQRGHGRSDKPLGGYAVDELADDLLAVLRLFAVDDCTLVGWSFGGQVAFRAAAQAPEVVTRLVLVGSNAVRASRSDAFPFGREPQPMLDALLEAERHDRIASRQQTIASGFAAVPDPHLLDWLVAQSMHMPSWAAVACYESMLTTDLVGDIRNVKQPVLQVIGAADPVHSAKGARWLAEQLPDSRLIELPDCGHYPMLEAPDAFAAALGAFIAS